METKDRILGASNELFLKYGIRSISMDDIAKHISVSKKTIYQFYTDKDALVYELIRQKLVSDEKKFRQLGKEASNVIEELFSIMKQMGSILASMPPSVFYDLQKYHDTSWALFLEFKEKCILQMVESALVKGVKQKLIRPDINVEILSRMRMEQITMGFNPDVFPPNKFKVLDVQLAMLDHFIYGICTLKGHKLINKYKQITEEE